MTTAHPLPVDEGAVAAVAEVLAAHAEVSVRRGNTDRGGLIHNERVCTCGQVLPWSDAMDAHRTHIALEIAATFGRHWDAVERLIAVRVAAAEKRGRVAALREAAADYDATQASPGDHAASWMRGWADADEDEYDRERADRQASDEAVGPLDRIERLKAAEADARAWEENYDGMFARWVECDAERLALKAELETANLRLRIQDEEAQ